jgi:hypothetical protein
MPAKYLNHLLTLVIFSGVIYTPLITAIIMTDLEQSEIEQRALTKRPHWKRRIDLNSYCREFDKYYADHFGFREKLVYWHNYAKYWLGDSAVKSVIIGKKGWLFYASTTDGDPIGDYRGLTALSQDKLATFIKRLEFKSDLMKKLGIEYIFVIAPNKETIYGEFLPDYLTKIGKITIYDQLVEQVNKSKVTLIDLRPALFKNKPNQQLYYQSDTHWNYFGANIAQYEIAKVIADKFPGKIMPQMTEQFNAEPMIGDLAKMLGLKKFFPEKILFPRLTDCFGNINLQPQAGHENSSVCHKSKLKVLFFGDSFGKGILPYFSKYFEQVNYVGIHPQLSDINKYIESTKPDLIIEERAERYLQYISPIDEAS